MDKKEVQKILMIMQTAYPRFYINQTKEELIGAIDLWYDLFKDDDVSLVVTSVKQLITTLQFPPTIADVKNVMYKLTNNDIDNMELWKELDNSARNCLYREQEAFDNLSPIVKKFVGNPAQLRELAMTDTGTFSTVVKGQFLKQIEVLKQREKDSNMMLPSTKKIIMQLQDKFGEDTQYIN